MLRFEFKIILFLNVIALLGFVFPKAIAEDLAPKSVIAFDKTSEVSSGNSIRLIDLVSIDSLAALEEAQLNLLNQEILEPMYSGESKDISTNELAKIIRKLNENEDLNFSSIKFILPEVISIKAYGQKVPEQKIVKQIMITALKNCNQCQIKIQKIHVPEFENKSALVGYQLDLTQLKIAGSFLLPLKLQYENQDKVAYVNGQLQTFMPALLTTRAMMPNQKINEEDFKKQNIEIIYAQDALATAEDIKDHVLNKTIALGRAIYKSDLKKEIAVNRGQTVQVMSGNDSFEVSSQMIAVDAGAVGDSIKLKNPDTQKTVSGEIIEKGLVRIQ